jgi:hypothetical protein
MLLSAINKMIKQSQSQLYDTCNFLNKISFLKYNFFIMLIILSLCVTFIKTQGIVCSRDKLIENLRDDF